MKSRNLLKFGLIAAAALMVFGCGSGDASSSASSSTPTAAPAAEGKKLKIGVSIPSADHGWTGGVKYWAEQEMKNHPEIEWVYQTADNPAKQNESLDAMLAQKIDGLVILAHASEPLTPKAKELHDAGVFIVNVDRGFTEPIADIFLAGDNKAFGRISAEFIAKQLNGKGNVLILEGVACNVNTDRVEGAKEIWAKNPGIKVLDSQQADWNMQKAFEKMQTMLVKHKEVNAIWAADDDMALGAEKALKEAGRDKNIFILGGAGMKDIVKRVMDGDPMFPGDVTYPPSMIAQGIKLAVETMKGKTKEELKARKPTNETVKIELIEKANAKDFYFPDSIY
jgi:ribose transport system substrate-binding protein